MTAFHYRIEMRVQLMKFKIKRINAEVEKAHQVVTESMPYIVLFGPFFLRDGCTEKELKQSIEGLVKNFDMIPYTIDGFEQSSGGKYGWTIGYRIVPSSRMMEIKQLFIDNLKEIAISIGRGDGDISKTWFHITLADKLSREKKDRIWNCISQDIEKEVIHPADSSEFQELIDRIKEFFRSSIFRFQAENHQKIFPLYLSEDILRITVTKGSKIFAEYDLFQKKWLSPKQAHSPSIWERTLQTYRRKTGRELVGPDYHSGEIYVIGDTHFGHRKIIGFCARPFSHLDVSVMDSVLINNWNSIVGPSDKIFFLGDFRLGWKAKSPRFYLNLLNGKKFFILGNHDDEFTEGMVYIIELKYHGQKFLLIHNPDRVYSEFDGWIIHGHVHNDNLKEYPFFNPEKKMINISAEVVDYQPVALSTLCSLIERCDRKILTYSEVNPRRNGTDGMTVPPLNGNNPVSPAERKEVLD